MRGRAFEKKVSEFVEGILLRVLFAESEFLN
jgi:hypothetical protein